MGGIATTAVVAAALAAVWIAVAATISVAAARRLRVANQVLAAARANSTLLQVSPARPLIVRGDGRVELDTQLLRELGLKAPPKTLADLGGTDTGIVADDLGRLAVEID